MTSLPTEWSSATAVPAYIRLRPAQNGDRHELHRGCYPELNYIEFAHRFERSLKRQADGRAVHLLAENTQPRAPQRIIGTAHLWRYTNVAELADVFIAPLWRSRGIGTALIMTLTRYALAEAWLPLEIGVETRNERALRLYQRLGFVVDREVRLGGGHTAFILRVPDDEEGLGS